MSNSRHQLDENVITVEEDKVQVPRLYKVILHNDDYTPMEFVVMILETIFHKDHESAVQIIESRSVRMRFLLIDRHAESDRLAHPDPSGLALGYRELDLHGIDRKALEVVQR